MFNHWILFSYINPVLSAGIIYAAIRQYRQTKRVTYLGLILPALYVLGIYFFYLQDLENPMTYQIPIRVAITLLLASVFVLTLSDCIAYRILKNGGGNE